MRHLVTLAAGAAAVHDGNDLLQLPSVADSILQYGNPQHPNEQTRLQEAGPAVQNLRDLWQAVSLAPQVAAGVGRGSLLFPALSRAAWSACLKGRKFVGLRMPWLKSSPGK
jgi:hypothetical protein